MISLMEKILMVGSSTQNLFLPISPSFWLVWLGWYSVASFCNGTSQRYYITFFIRFLSRFYEAKATSLFFYSDNQKPNDERITKKSHKIHDCAKTLHMAILRSPHKHTSSANKKS
ncbi:unnamed protein product [Orchesella dallaii]|uniref:Uncharacterized protein n=1 Tax=Orchesella dallaii TaxID=48710 RepID=A0ABP1R396_9HEXA